jgi:hypothetical protein
LGDFETRVPLGRRGRRFRLLLELLLLRRHGRILAGELVLVNEGDVLEIGNSGLVGDELPVRIEESALVAGPGLVPGRPQDAIVRGDEEGDADQGRAGLPAVQDGRRTPGTADRGSSPPDSPDLVPHQETTWTSRRPWLLEPLEEGFFAVYRADGDDREQDSNKNGQEEQQPDVFREPTWAIFPPVSGRL